MNRVAILSNAGSGRNRRRSELLRVLDATSGVHHVVTADADELPEALAMVLAAAPSVLAVNGGDGTVQAVLTACADLRDSGRLDGPLPALAVLPAGSTNMSAHDLGCGGRMQRRVGDLLALRDRERSAWRTELRAPLAVTEPDGTRRIGFFFGMGTIVRGIEYWHDRLHHGGGAGEWGAGAALARAAWGIFRRQPPFDVPARVSIRRTGHDAASIASRDVSFLLATTMRRLFLDITPFWGEDVGPVTITWVDDGARRFLRRVPALLQGREERLPAAEGYHCRRADAVALTFDEPWALDGELFSAAGELAIAPAEPFEFVHLADDLAAEQGT